MFDPRPLYCSSLTTAVVGTYVYINFVDFSSAYCGTNHGAVAGDINDSRWNLGYKFSQVANFWSPILFSS